MTAVIRAVAAMQEGSHGTLPRQANRFSISLRANQPLAHHMIHQPMGEEMLMASASVVAKYHLHKSPFHYLLTSLVTLAFSPFR